MYSKKERSEGKLQGASKDQ